MNCAWLFSEVNTSALGIVGGIRNSYGPTVSPFVGVTEDQDSRWVTMSYIANLVTGC